MRPLAPETVAIVEDDPLTRTLARRWLEEAGYDVVEHAQGREAIESSRAWSVVCLDLGSIDRP